MSTKYSAVSTRTVTGTQAFVAYRAVLDIERPIPDPMASVVVVEVSGSKIEPVR